MPGGNESDIYDAIDEALQVWRQGDCVLGEHWFAYRVDLRLGLTEGARVAADAGVDLAETQVPGLVVVTQTCDIVRACRDRPYIEICPLIDVPAHDLNQIERGQRPAFAYVPLLAAQRLVADLDRVMTVEKSIAAGWTRVPGWTSDAEGRAFAEALARKRARPAFPDDFVVFAGRLESRLKEKHNRQSDEGRALRALHEIRVLASPSWNHPEVTLMFYFVRGDQDADFEGTSWDKHLEAWTKLITPAGRFRAYAVVTTLERMTAEDYVHSDRLDLDHLSSRTTT